MGGSPCSASVAPLAEHVSRTIEHRRRKAALTSRFSVRNTVVMVVLSILAAATWIATWQRQDVNPLVDRGGATEPLGYYARGARLSGTDEQGRLTYRVFAERLEELPGEERVQLIGVNVDYQPSDDTEWTLMAATAKYARDGSQIDFLGNVEVRSLPAGGSRSVAIFTDKLVFSPDTSSAETDEQVEIRVGDWQLQGTGLRSDLKGGSLKLESEVHGTLAP
jgi:LPS export ABC transporter protein LptC